MMSKVNAQQEHAQSLDANSPLRKFRSNFFIPTKVDLSRPSLSKQPSETTSEPCIYLCGNSLGLQPRRVRQRIETFLTQWSTKAVTGHFVEHDDSDLPPFLHVDDHAAKLMAPVVGALDSEVAVMGTLTANLHFMMASFYRPTKERFKIILEGKAFPSDHYAIESQVAQHGFNPKEAMVLLEPLSPSETATLTTAQILEAIDTYASEAALILLPGVQFYTGQYFDIPRITAHAHSKCILIGWDCAHAAGNVDLKLHEWDVDFAVWCTYKYLNSGPGAMAGIFVHEKHGKVDMKAKEGEQFRPRLSGWWGADKDTRFEMNNDFVPRPGAAGYQLSNPSALDLSAVVASLEIFNETSMADLRKKSLALTNYLDDLLDHMVSDSRFKSVPFTIITPKNPEERGAQLSIRLRPGLLDPVLEYLSKNGVIVDERKPDVIRVAPAPLYNTFEDVWMFCQIFSEACKVALAAKDNMPNGSS